MKFTVNKCFFNSYFSSIGMPFLTSVFCTFDDAFGASLRKDAFRYTREHTLAEGAKSCLFVIERAVSDGQKESIAATLQ